MLASSRVALAHPTMADDEGNIRPSSPCTRSCWRDSGRNVVIEDGERDATASSGTLARRRSGRWENERVVGINETNRSATVWIQKIFNVGSGADRVVSRKRKTRTDLANQFYCRYQLSIRRQSRCVTVSVNLKGKSWRSIISYAL